MYINSGKFDLAQAELEKANQLSPENGIILANLGIALKNLGNIAAAEDFYKKAEAKGIDLSYHRAVIAVKKGDYATAMSLFNKAGKKDYNYALCQILSGDANGAKATLDNMKPEELTWDHYYLRAIAGARLSNADVVTTNLTRAVQLNGDVRQLAKEDVEFIKYFGNPTFEGAIR